MLVRVGDIDELGKYVRVRMIGLPLDTDDRMLYDGDYNDVGLLLILKGSIKASCCSCRWG